MRPLSAAALDRLEREAFGYFRKNANAKTGLVADCTRPGAPASIAACGLALTAYPVAVERGYLSRAAAAERVRRLLRFFAEGEQGEGPEAIGNRGFFYHFLDMASGKRVWECEVSTIDSAYVFAGALAASLYFDGSERIERRIRDFADALCRRADWEWARNGGATVTHGWRPETGFIPFRWEGYSEALVLYALALGSATHPIPEESYRAWTETYWWRNVYGIDYLHAGPLFIHQLSHVWIDFRGIQDGYMRERGSDYFENSRRATHIQREYAIRNPLKFREYGANCWGITASEGPGPAVLEIESVKRRFFSYVARGIPEGPDDGTIAPWGAVASLPFAPDVVLPTIRHLIKTLGVGSTSPFGLEATFNPTFPDSGTRSGWLSPYNFGLNDGPIVLMIENYRTGLIWKLTRGCEPLVRGLRRAGFRGGWL
ncbi:MAG TPA: glucoamylase family protein [Thermoanaerobaculia bacterium]|nr:glucoamylase family protein [Thermoanaerobaculia bacterium]